jgi:hypothetical protein
VSTEAAHAKPWLVAAPALSSFILALHDLGPELPPGRRRGVLTPRSRPFRNGTNRLRIRTEWNFDSLSTALAAKQKQGY